MSDKIKKVDVTDLVDYGSVDDEFLEFKKCICGKEFKEYTSISIYSDDPFICECGRKFYFIDKVTIFEVV